MESSGSFGAPEREEAEETDSDLWEGRKGVGSVATRRGGGCRVFVGMGASIFAHSCRMSECSNEGAKCDAPA